MPVFEYQCSACGENFEKLVFGKQEVRCPKCSSENIRKKFSTFGMSGVRNTSSLGCSSCSSGSCSSCK